MAFGEKRVWNNNGVFNAWSTRRKIEAERWDPTEIGSIDSFPWNLAMDQKMTESYWARHLQGRNPASTEMSRSTGTLRTMSQRDGPDPGCQSTRPNKSAYRLKPGAISRRRVASPQSPARRTPIRGRALRRLWPFGPAHSAPAVCEEACARMRARRCDGTDGWVRCTGVALMSHAVC